MAIIKCPECGHSVPDNAPFCPGCGIKIANNLKKCPECGEVVFSSTDTCPQCGHSYTASAEPAKASAATGQEAEEEEILGYTTPQAKPKKKKRHTALIVSTLVIIACIIGGTAGYIYMRSQEQAEEMEAAVRLLDGCLDPDEYQAFLDAYPSYPRRKELEARMTKLRTENEAWEAIRTSPSKNDFIQFLNRFPGSRFEAACHQKIDSLDWLDALATNTPDAVTRYMAEHPDGAYADEARKMADDIVSLTVRPQERARLAQVSRAFFTALSANDLATVVRLTPDVMRDFLSTPQATRADVAITMQQMHAGTADAPSYTVGSDFVVTKRTVEPDSIVYNVAYTVEERRGLTGTGTPTAYKVFMEVDRQMKIHSVQMKE